MVYVCPYTGKSFFDEQELRSYITSSTEGPLKGKTGLALDRDIITVDISGVDVETVTEENLKTVDLDSFSDPATGLTVADVLTGAEAAEEDDEADDEMSEATQSELSDTTEEEQTKTRKEGQLEQISGSKRKAIVQNTFRNPEWDYADIADEVGSSENYAQNEIEKIHNGRWEPTAISMVITGINAQEIKERIESGELASYTLNEDKVEEADDEEEAHTTIRGDKKQQILQLALEHPDWDYRAVAEEVGSSEGHARSIIKALHDGEYDPVELTVIVTGKKKDDIEAALDAGEIASYTREDTSEATDEPEPEPEPEPEESETELSFAESFAEAVEQDDLRRFTVAELRSNISDVEDTELLSKARDLDGRSTATTLYKNRIDSLSPEDTPVTWTDDEDTEAETVEDEVVDETETDTETEPEVDTETETPTVAAGGDEELREAVRDFREEFEQRLEEAEEEAEMLEHADFAKGKAKMAQLGLELLPEELLEQTSQ